MKLIQFLILMFLSAFAGFAQALRRESLAANSRGAAGRFDLLAANSALLNDNAKVFGAYNPDAAHGVMMAANDANFDAAHLSEPLTEFIAETADEEGLDVLREQACPSVPVGRAFTYRVHDSVEDFQAAINDEDIREIGGDFPIIRLTGTQTNGRTHNKGLTMALDNDQGGEDPAVQQRAIVNLRNRLLRTELYRLEALLEANDTATTPNWGASNTSADPDGDLMSAINLSGDARGIDANTVLYGGGAWVTRFLSLGIGSNAARHQTRNLSPEQLRDLMQVDRLIRAKFRRQSSASAKAKIVGDKVFVYYVKPGAMPGDASNVKRFVTPVPGGGVFRTYVQPMLKKTMVTLEHYSSIDLTSSLGIRKIAPTYT